MVQIQSTAVMKDVPSISSEKNPSWPDIADSFVGLGKPFD